MSFVDVDEVMNRDMFDSPEDYEIYIRSMIDHTMYILYGIVPSELMEDETRDPVFKTPESKDKMMKCDDIAPQESQPITSPNSVVEFPKLSPIITSTDKVDDTMND
jgi:hypothetical protein